MMGVDEKFRHFLLRRIRPLSNDTLRKYEELAACQTEMVQAWEVLEHDQTYRRAFSVSAPPEPEGGITTPDQKLDARAIEKEQSRLKQSVSTMDQRLTRTMEPYEREYRTLHALWLARRRLALTTGNFFQLSLRPSKLGRFLTAWLHYRTTQLRSFFVLFGTFFQDMTNRRRRLTKAT